MYLVSKKTDNGTSIFLKKAGSGFVFENRIKRAHIFDSHQEATDALLKFTSNDNYDGGNKRLWRVIGKEDIIKMNEERFLMQLSMAISLFERKSLVKVGTIEVINGRAISYTLIK